MRFQPAALIVLALGLVPSTPGAQPQAGGAQALDALAATERRFAASAREQGWRAAFLEYFAADSIAFAPDPVSARDRLATRPPRPFSEEELTWEPKAGDIAASGEMGWLTGPSTFIDHTATQPKPAYGNYLSIWKKQKDGRWRVFIDLGTNVPAPAAFSPWFTHVTAVPRYHERTAASSASADLLAADRRLNDLLKGAAASPSYLARIVEHARLHRSGTTPAIAVGADQIKQWFAANPGILTATATAGEAAASGDLGYVYGRYDLAGVTPQHGAYVRIWSRAGNGEWRVAADVTAPTGDQIGRAESSSKARMNPKDSQRYVWIPRGTFQMGCSPRDSDCFEDEYPSHPVTISRGFWMGQTEVTVEAFRRFSRAANTPMPDGELGDRYPVVNVTWSEAADYCRWAGGRLPSEAEWEYAARGGVDAARYGPLDEVAWYDANSQGRLHEVATKQPNRYGLYDMLGNVFEWASDFYDRTYYRQEVTLDPRGPDHPLDDPRTPARGPGGHQYRVLRGGNCGLDSRFERVSCRLRHDMDRRSSSGGLRCVLEVSP